MVELNWENNVCSTGETGTVDGAEYGVVLKTGGDLPQFLAVE